MGAHPELRQDEDLQLQAYVPRLMTRTETAQKQREMDQATQKRDQENAQKEKRMARIKAMQDQDPLATFASCWEATATQELPPATVKKPPVVTPRPAKAPLPDMVFGEDPPFENLPRGTVLVYAVDDGRES